MKIAMVSVSVTSHVAEVSAALARCGHEVSVYTRRNDPEVAERVETPAGLHGGAPACRTARAVPKDELLQHMGPFARNLVAQWAADRPDVAHAHFWISGIATQLAARQLDCLRSRHSTRSAWSSAVPGCQDTSPQARLRIEAMVARAATGWPPPVPTKPSS